MRAVFPATRALTGTRQPYHPEDGEGPCRFVRLEEFSLETVPVTNARFSTFVAATGYVTQAEIFGWAAVFITRQEPERSTGWQAVKNACWFAPEGRGSDIRDRMDHPVVQVSFTDAAAFAAWTGGRLPRESEWEHAARGGLPDPRFPWGDDEPDDERIFCNIWQGRFPAENTQRDGYSATSPVDVFPPNGAGLHDMAGNVWEWTADPFHVHSVSTAAHRRNAAACANEERLLKGGSFLCHRSHCYRYRIAGRLALSASSCANNVGFRVAYTD